MVDETGENTCRSRSPRTSDGVMSAVPVNPPTKDTFLISTAEARATCNGRNPPTPLWPMRMRELRRLASSTSWMVHHDELFGTATKAGDLRTPLTHIHALRSNPSAGV